MIVAKEGKGCGSRRGGERKGCGSWKGRDVVVGDGGGRKVCDSRKGRKGTW